MNTVLSTCRNLFERFLTLISLFRSLHHHFILLHLQSTLSLEVSVSSSNLQCAPNVYPILQYTTFHKINHQRSEFDNIYATLSAWHLRDIFIRGFNTTATSTTTTTTTTATATVPWHLQKSNGRSIYKRTMTEPSTKQQLSWHLQNINGCGIYKTTMIVASTERINQDNIKINHRRSGSNGSTTDEVNLKNITTNHR